jgi:hypothetical protein
MGTQKHVWSVKPDIPYKEYVYIKPTSVRGARRTRGDLSLGHEITYTSIYHF